MTPLTHTSPPRPIEHLGEHSALTKRLIADGLKPTVPPEAINVSGDPLGPWYFVGGGDFAAINAAEAWLSARGFSVGIMQGHAPRGILYGEFAVQKWRNLRPADRASLHGWLTGSRSGSATITFSRTLPTPGLAALTTQGRAA